MPGGSSSRLALVHRRSFTRRGSIETDFDDLFSPSLPWTKRAFQHMRAPPQFDILVVVNALSPGLVEQAAHKLAWALAARKHVVRDVRESQSGEFFKQNELFLPTSKVTAIADGLTRAAMTPKRTSAVKSAGLTLPRATVAP